MPKRTRVGCVLYLPSSPPQFSSSSFPTCVLTIASSGHRLISCALAASYSAVLNHILHLVDTTGTYLRRVRAQSAAAAAGGPAGAKLGPASCAELAGGRAAARCTEVLFLWEQFRHACLGMPPAIHMDVRMSYLCSRHCDVPASRSGSYLCIMYQCLFNNQTRASGDEDVEFVYWRRTTTHATTPKSKEYTALQNGYIRY